MSAGSTITSNFDAGSGTLTLSGAASLADYEAALRTVALRVNEELPGTSAREISFSVTEDDGTSDTVVREVAFTYVCPAGTEAMGDTCIAEPAGEGGAAGAGGEASGGQTTGGQGGNTGGTDGVGGGADAGAAVPGAAGAGGASMNPGAASDDGGCSCRIGYAGSGSSWAGLIVAFLGLAAARWRTRRLR